MDFAVAPEVGTRSEGRVAAIHKTGEGRIPWAQVKRKIFIILFIYLLFIYYQSKDNNYQSFLRNKMSYCHDLNWDIAMAFFFFFFFFFFWTCLIFVNFGLLSIQHYYGKCFIINRRKIRLLFENRPALYFWNFIFVTAYKIAIYFLIPYQRYCFNFLIIFFMYKSQIFDLIMILVMEILLYNVYKIVNK